VVRVELTCLAAVDFELEPKGMLPLLLTIVRTARRHTGSIFL
jgi:hypothetical protein